MTYDIKSISIQGTGHLQEQLVINLGRDETDLPSGALIDPSDFGTFLDFWLDLLLENAEVVDTTAEEVTEGDEENEGEGEVTGEPVEGSAE